MQAIESAPSEAPNGLLFSCRIDLPDGHYSKKNSKSIAWRGKYSAARPFIRTNDRAAAIERYVLLCLQRIVSELRDHRTIELPVHVMLDLSCDSVLTKKGVISRSGGDLDNLIQGPIDCLVKAGIIADDSYITRLSARKRQGENSVAIKIYRDEAIETNPRLPGL